jgi:ATP-dependent protease ClpP protease subunit
MIKVIGEINAETFEKYLNQIEHDPRDSRVLICSPGGDIGYTLAILDDIDFAKRMTHATGICQSAAAVLATAGEGKRVCTMDCLFRFMPPVKEKIEDPETHEIVEKVPDLRYYLHSLLVARLAQRLKTPVADISLYFDGEFIDSLKAKRLGLIDEVISTEESNGNSDRFPGSEESFAIPRHRVADNPFPL